MALLVSVVVGITVFCVVAVLLDAHLPPSRD